MTESVNGEGRGTNTRLPRGGRLLGPLLGLVFLIYPVRAVLTSEPTPVRIALALGGAGLFAVAFLWLMWTQEPLWSPSAEPSEVAAGIMLLTTEAYVAIAGLAAVTFGLGLLSGMAWLVLPTAVIGLWATAFVRQVAAVAELRSAREELARLAVDEERLRFARDLHDLLGHSLSLITLKSELAGRLLPNGPEKAEAEVQDIEEVARQALREVREAVAGYRSPTLDEELAGAAEMLEAAGIDCRIENGAGLLPKETDGVLAWAVREGTTNVIRHSHARACRIVLAREDGEVYAEITDDGRGETNEETSGSGLSGLAERVAGFGDGEFEAGPLPEGGFRLRVSLPLRRVGAR
jgi:two-component system sensor histidine kinase DesK